MGTLLVRILVVLTALSVSCATESRGLPELLQDLAGIQRGAGEEIKGIAQSQRQMVMVLLRFLGKEENCQSQTLESKQSELILALNTLAGGLVRGFDVIEAKSVETLQTLEKNITHALKSLTDRLDVIEAKVDTQADEMKANQTSCQEGLEAGKRRLEAMQEQLTRVASRRECWQPFERVGDDCVHWHDKWMSWAAARRYCRGLGGDLLVPSDKERFVVDGIYRQMSGPHPPLFDFLESKRIIFDKSKKWTTTWIGGSVDGDGKAAWTTGEKARGSDIKPHECISAGVHKDEGYGTFSKPCDETKYPVCHSL